MKRQIRERLKKDKAKRVAYLQAARFGNKYTPIENHKLLIFLEIVKFAEAKGWSLEQIVKDAKEIDKKLTKFLTKDPLVVRSLKRAKIKSLVCPKCQKILTLTAVSLPQGKPNVNGYKSFLDCSNCGFELFTKKSVAEITEEGNGNSI